MPTSVGVHAHGYADECRADLAQCGREVEMERLPDGARVVRWNGSVTTDNTLRMITWEQMVVWSRWARAGPDMRPRPTWRAGSRLLE